MVCTPYTANAPSEATATLVTLRIFNTSAPVIGCFPAPLAANANTWIPRTARTVRMNVITPQAAGALQTGWPLGGALLLGRRRRPFALEAAHQLALRWLRV